jgi:uncharacterized phage infection (PIP) family protein YhgE
MSRLTYPADDASDRVEAISESLSHQAAMLSTAKDRVAEQAKLSRFDDLAETAMRHVADSATATGASVHSATSEIELASEEMLDALLARALSVMAEFRDSVTGMSTASSDATGAILSNVDDVRSRIAERTGEMTGGVGAAAAEMIARLDEVSGRVKQQADSLTSAMEQVAAQAGGARENGRWRPETVIRRSRQCRRRRRRTNRSLWRPDRRPCRPVHRIGRPGGERSHFRDRYL